MARKLFLGYKLRRLRDTRNLSQAALAGLLEVSPSYLNQIENNQRPLTVPVLLRIAKVFDVELAQLIEDEDARLIADVREILADPVFGAEPFRLAELRTVVDASPEMARRLLLLYRSYQQVNERLQWLSENLSVPPSAPNFPYEAVRDFFYASNNYFDSLDEAAERLWQTEGYRQGELAPQLVETLKTRHSIHVRVVSEGDPPPPRAFDEASRTLSLSAFLAPASQTFHLAHRIGLEGFREVIDSLVTQAKLPSDDARAICRAGLANYFAGALVMPYRDFAEQARRVRHDVQILQGRFGASFEQVCHRLSTLQRPGARGIPFYFVRVDMAGNITKRHSATSFHFTRFGGACPLLNVHEAFAQPGRILAQLARMPEGTAYISIARSVTKRGGAYRRPDRRYAVGLGCEAVHAPELVYADGLDASDPAAAIPIGINCRVCERTDCRQRAFPMVGGRVAVDVDHRG